MNQTTFSLHKQVLDTLTDGVTIQNKNFDVLYQNKSMIRAFGDQIGQKCFAAYERRGQICEGCGLHEVFRTGEPVIVHRTALTQDGAPSHWENSCFPVFDDEGAIIAGVEVCRDVTSRVSLAEEVRNRSIELGMLNDKLSRKSEELEKAYKDLKTAHSQMLQQEKMASIGQLAAGVAHEINNPLAFIISNLSTFGQYSRELGGFLDTLEGSLCGLAAELPNHDALDEFKRLREASDIEFILEDIQQIVIESLDGGARMKEIVQNLKNFARLDEGGFKQADINQGLESTLKIVQNELKYKAEVTISLGKIPEIMCNPGQLNQVFMNLLVNAAQAIEDRGRIDIKTFKEAETVIVEITDTGCGIPEDKIYRVFEPFFTTKDIGKGTGLGLSIAYDIVEKHGGTILVQSQVGKGTRFTIRLPTGLDAEMN